MMLTASITGLEHNRGNWLRGLHTGVDKGGHSLWVLWHVKEQVSDLSEER